MMSMGIRELWSHFGSISATLMFLHAIIQQYFPSQLRDLFDKYSNKIVSIFYPYIHITFHEYSGDRFKRSETFEDIRTYLSANSSSKAKRLKANDVKDSKSLVLSIDDYEEVTDEFRGVKLWWSSSKQSQRSMFTFYPNSDEKRYYTLSFHRRHSELVKCEYLNHVIGEGKSVAVKNRQRKLYTNGCSENWYGEKRTKWTHVQFEHPASFDTLAMPPGKKKEILDDLVKFQRGKEYYKKIGKAWKRGYLLYGPPGTGKSTMICAMANFLDYDVFDLELTAVKENTELRKLLIDTTEKSIIVIEDIDCSLDLTGQRAKKAKKKDDEEDEKKDPIEKKKDEMGKDSEKSKVTLSGLLNFIDGIWSACGGERVIVFTTNHVDKLDPALIRRGRMDKHIELSYCCFETFKVLARNYLDVESHEVFGEIERLLGETEMSPADVAENLMPKSEEEDSETCLKRLVDELEKAKKKAEEEAKLKAEEEEREEKEKEEKKNEEKVKGEKKNEDEVKGEKKNEDKVECNGKLDKEEKVKENGST